MYFRYRNIRKYVTFVLNKGSGLRDVRIRSGDDKYSCYIAE